MAQAIARPAVFVLAVLYALHSKSVAAFEWKSLWLNNNQQAKALLDSGSSIEAAELFEDQQWRGVSHFEAGEFDKAAQEFSNGGNGVSRYNQGVAEVMGGNFSEAIESFESVLQSEPNNKDAAHNLNIARELADLQQQQNKRNEPSKNEDQDGENSDQEASDQTKNQPADGSEQPQSSSESSRQSESDQNSDQPDSQTDGELSENVANAEQSPGSESEEAAREELKEALSAQEQSQEAEPNAGQENSTAMADGQPLTEESQATEQWLRRIPDDPSQLLRNKIKLNHLLRHQDVGDTPEPW